MAGESCNDKADIIKPSSSNSSSSSSSSSPPPSHPSAESKPPPSLFLRPQEFLASERPDRPPEAPLLAAGATGGCSVGSSSPAKPAAEPQAPETPVRFCNRCSSCRKRVGLAGFRCRCGELFCPLHRHSATHDCCFDYKAAGREQIARDNPLIRAAKIIKI